MDVLKGYETSVKFPVPTTTAYATYSISRDGVDIGLPGNATIVNGVATVALPYGAVAEEGDATITLTFYQGNTPYVATKTVRVVTPYLNIWDLQEEFGDEFTDTELLKGEASARFIINAHTGQGFGRRAGINVVNGTGVSKLALPERLISLTSINGNIDYGLWFTAVGDGWYLSQVPLDIPPVRADYYGLNMTRSGVIHNPNNVSIGRFLADTRYTIEGVWGWSEVPSSISEAAMLLVNDYLGMESQYRDRYLTSMTAADWRLQLNSGAFSNTGNVRADQLLADYRVPKGWLIV